MIILFMILYTTVASLINGTSPLTSTMNLLGYEPIKSGNTTHLNTTALKTTVKSLAKSTVKKKSPDIPPKQINYVTKQIASCPEVGYFFKREPQNSIDASQCYLCFCSDPQRAICWPRENKRCDMEHYHHHGVGKRDVRTRRSPGFSDIFFRDASLDIFNKNTPAQCKPYESSFSEGCPPADWCIGCTVCDCDSNGRWDCHTLSFCPDQEAKKDNSKQEKHSDKHLRQSKKKIYKERRSKNAIASQRNVGKVKSKSTQKKSSESKAATISGKKTMQNKKRPQINQSIKKKFKKKNKFEMSESTPLKKNTTQLVKELSKKKREVKKNMKKTGIISKRDAKNNSTALTKNASKKNNTITKNKPTRIKSEKTIPPKNNETKKSNLVKKSKPVIKEVTQKKTTEAKANLRQSLRQIPQRNPTSISAKYAKKTKKPLAKKLNDKNFNKTLKEPNTNNKKIQAIENRKKQKYVKNKKKIRQDLKNKKLQRNKKNDKAQTKKIQKASNSTTDIIRHIEAKITDLKSGKHSKKRLIDENGIEYDFPEAINNRKRVKRHVTDSFNLLNITKLIENKNKTITGNVTDMKTVTKPVVDLDKDKINSVNFTTPKSFTINVNYLNETTVNSIFKNKILNVVSPLTENFITEYKTTNTITKPSIPFNTSDFSAKPSVSIIETTTSISMDEEPTVSLTSYYMYQVDETIKTTPDLNKTKTFSAKRSLSEISNLKNDTYETKNIVFETLDLKETKIYTTESLNENEFNKNSAQPNATTLKYTEKYKDLGKNIRSDDMESSKPNHKLESVNLTIQDLKDKRRKIYSSDLTRKLGSTDKKYRLRKIVHVYNRNRTRLDELYLTKKKKNITNERLSSLQNFIKNHISLLNKRNSTKKNGTHNVKVMTYLKKFFKNILTTQKKTKVLLQNETTPLTINKSKFIKTLCETFGPCYLTQQKKLLLNARIDDLSLETNKMFKTIKVIKGLLKLLSLGKNNKNQNISNEDKDAFNFNTDVRKLGSILRDNYVEEQKVNLTTTELNQINYVKRNMQFFAQSTASFAKILNEIIDVLIAPGNTSGYMGKYSEGLKSKTEKQAETFQKLKNLLISYKLLQNRFLQKMYEILGNIYPVQTDKKKISAVDKANKTATLHVYTKNIIKNLRKLKNLAQVVLSKTTTHPRKRRDLRDEESMEYLLVLMEYLLKHSYQKDPVTDGIDLLIEAIKNAPDIRVIQKQVLQKHTLSYNVTNTQTGQNELVNNVSDNKVSEPNNISRELNYTSKKDNSQINNIDSMDNESDFDYLSIMNRRVNDEITFTTEVNDYKTYHKEQNTEDTAILELSSAKQQTESSFILSPPSSSLKTILLDDYNKKKDKVMSGGDDDDFEKRINIFSGDLDDETLTTPPSTKQRHKIKYNKVVTDKYIEIKEGLKETDVDDNLKSDFKDDMSLSTSESKNNKYLDWLDETFEEEIKEVNDTEKVKPLLRTKPTHETVLRRPQEKDISLSDETYNTKKRDLDSEDKIYNKEMNLLNSLDDNFGKSESDGLDSKDTFELHQESD